MRALTHRADALPALAEVFREYGFEGASLSLISERTGLGKGSLYNFFPGGKEEMMTAVLAEVHDWFDAAIFRPLECATDPASAIAAMVHNAETYFKSGRRVCLVGCLALGASRDRFALQLKAYFARWVASLAACLVRAHVPVPEANGLAEGAIAGIQGAIILSRALGDETVFGRIVRDHEHRLLDAMPGHDDGARKSEVERTDP